MSVTFTVAGDTPDYDNPTTFLNLANGNAIDLFDWLSIPTDQNDIYGEIDARELAARCRRRLWDVTRNHDCGLAPEVDRKPGCATLHFFGRHPDYLREKTALLLELAERAGDGTVRWA